MSYVWFVLFVVGVPVAYYLGGHPQAMSSIKQAIVQMMQKGANK